MDRWIDAVQTDRSGRSQTEKVRADRPGDLTDHCEPANGTTISGTDCPSVNRFYESATNVAGESMRNDILKCELKPLRREDYPGISFSNGQWGTLQRVFGTGVCDWSKPGVGETDTIPWLSYANKPGGEALGRVPASVAFSDIRVLRVTAALRRLRRARTTRIVLDKPKGSVSMRRVTVRVTDARGRLIASSKARTIRAARTGVTLRRARRVPAGATLSVVVHARDLAGQPIASPLVRVRG
jgi:hypothetical protein